MTTVETFNSYKIVAMCTQSKFGQRKKREEKRRKKHQNKNKQINKQTRTNNKPARGTGYL